MSKAGKAANFAITDRKLYVLVVTLSTQDNTKLLQQLKSGFKHTINWKKYQSKASTQEQKKYIDYLIDPNFWIFNKLFVLSFEDNAVRILHTEYFLPK